MQKSENDFFKKVVTKETKSLICGYRLNLEQRLKKNIYIYNISPQIIRYSTLTQIYVSVIRQAIAWQGRGEVHIENKLGFHRYRKIKFKLKLEYLRI